METNFQTSFIPKKIVIPPGVATHASYTGSIFMAVATILFIASLVGAVLTFAGKGLLETQQKSLKINLAENEKRFNVPLIEELKKANVKIDFVNQILKKHVAVSEVFAIIEGLTIDGVRFSSFEFSDNSMPSGGSAAMTKDAKTYKIKMKGLANSFSSVAFQSDVFSHSQKYGTNKVLKNPVLSDLAVDTDGNVSFNFTADVSASDISYEKAVTGESDATQNNIK